MLTKETRTQVDALPDGRLQMQRFTVVLEDGAEVGRSKTEARVFTPGDDLTDADAKVAAIAGAIWTPELVEEHKGKLSSADLFRKAQEARRTKTGAKDTVPSNPSEEPPL